MHEIAQVMNRSKATISRHSTRLGLSWDRSATANAAKARSIDAKARRAELEILLLEDASRLRAQIWRKTTYVDHGGKDYVEVKWSQNQPNAGDKLKLMQAATAAIDRSLKISQHDNDGGTTEASSMLQRLAETLGVPTPGAEPAQSAAANTDLEDIL